MGREIIPNATKLKIALAFHFGADKSTAGIAAATGFSKWKCGCVIGKILDNLQNPE